MAYFAWVRSQSVWAPPALEPQIIHDEGMADHKALMGSLKIVKRYPLREGEEESSLDVLIKRYPPPAMEDPDEEVNKTKRSDS